VEPTHEFGSGLGSDKMNHLVGREKGEIIFHELDFVAYYLLTTYHRSTKQPRLLDAMIDRKK
jgi:hypothetical protein